MLEKEKTIRATQKNKLKKTVKNIIAVALIVSISVAATMAYLSTTATPLNNVFTGSKGIGLELTEPGFTEDVTGKNYTPGKTMTKDPRVKNISDNSQDAKEWVAIMVCYQLYGKQASKNDLEGKIIKTIDINDDVNDDGKYWTLIKAGDYYDIYIYNKTLAYDEESTTLFDEVTILTENELEVAGEYTSDTLPDFNIHVLGAAIKNEYTYEEIVDEIKSIKEPTTLNELRSKVDSEKETEIKNNLIAVLEKNVATLNIPS